MPILRKLAVPNVPLFTGIDTDDLQSVKSYLSTLSDFFYNCNGLIEESNLTMPSSTFGWPDGVITTLASSITIPTGFVNNISDIVFKINRRSDSSSGTAVMLYNIYRFRDGLSYVTLGGGGIDFTPGDVNTHTTTITLTGPNTSPGDVVRLDVVRDGGNAGDTIAAPIANDGVTVSFT